MDPLNEAIENHLQIFPGVFHVGNFKIHKKYPRVVCISEIVIPPSNSLCYMKTLLPEFNECSRPDGSINLVGGHMVMKRIIESRSETLLKFSNGETIGDIFGRRRAFKIPSMGDILFYIGVDFDNIYLPSEKIYDFRVQEIRVLFSVGEEESLSFFRDIVVDNLCGTVNCLKFDSTPLLLHTIHGTVRWNSDGDSAIFQGVKNIDYITDYVLTPYCKVLDRDSLHVNMAVLSAWVGKSFLSSATKTSMLEKSMSYVWGSECIHFYTRTETGGGVVKFRVKCWDRLSRNNNINLLISNVETVKNHICTISSSGFTMIHFFWPQTMRWDDIIRKDMMVASKHLVDLIRECS